MSDIQVRFASPQDAPAVAALHVLACRAAYALQVPEAHWDATSMAKRTAYWKEAIDYGEPQVMVALDGHAIVGFVGFDRSRDPKSKNTTGEIWAIYVVPERIGQGIGQLARTLGYLGKGAAVQGAVRLARNDFLFAKLRSGVFEDARNEQGAVHHEARCGHGESLQ